MIRNAALAALLVSTALCTSAMAQTSTPPNPPLAEGAFATSDATDPYLWLEEIEGERAMAWVNEQNERSLGVLRGDPVMNRCMRRRWRSSSRATAFRPRASAVRARPR